LWKHHSNKPIDGGIVSYQVNGCQYIAVAEGLTSDIWPTQIASPRGDLRVVVKLATKNTRSARAERVFLVSYSPS